MASWKRITGAKYGFEGKGITKRGRKRTDKKKKNNDDEGVSGYPTKPDDTASHNKKGS
jgi:hypothetical protein